MQHKAMDIRKGIKSAFTKLFEPKGVKEIAPEANMYQYPNYYPQIIRQYYTGEKTPGEMGAAKDYHLHYQQLRARSYQSYLESEVTQAIINKYVKWVAGTGLYVQSEPEIRVLEQEGIKISEDFTDNVQSRYNVWCNSRFSDAAQMCSINQISPEAFKNALLGGDVLVVNFVEKGKVTQQIIDGSHVTNPETTSTYYKDAVAAGNRIEYGVELDSNNAHVAYYVCGAGNKFYRIERIGKKSGRLLATLVYGGKYRIDNVRGLPLMASNLETLKKLERYKEATVGSAEERQKIAMVVEHSADSTGENVFLSKVAQAGSLGSAEANETKSTSEYETTATKVATTTNKAAFNMPVGAQLKMLESKNELYFKDFYTTNVQFICAGVGIPYEVALAMFNSNYSASRAAIKEWEHNMLIERQKFSDQYYKPHYDLWLEMEILNGKINAPGYIKAINEGNIMAIEAYRNARFLGENVPHIDPVKEVMAERLKLGDDTTPLTDYDQVTERLGSGDFKQIINKVNQQKKIIPKLPEPKKENLKAEAWKMILNENN